MDILIGIKELSNSAILKTILSTNIRQLRKNGYWICFIKLTGMSNKPKSIYIHTYMYIRIHFVGEKMNCKCIIYIIID